MRRVLIALALLFLPLAPASAEDLTYCNQAIGAQEAGNHDLAIDYYTRCLNEGDLSRGNQVIIYNGRSNAYRDKGEDDRAIADHDQALRLDPDFALAFNNRGNAYSRKGEYDRAIADYDRALRLDPDYALAYNNRGRVHFNRGRFAQAVPDLRRAVAADPEYAYWPIWLYLAQARAGQGGRAELKDNARRLDLSDWPGPVVRMFLGELGAQAVADMGKANATRKDKERRAEAYFYVGQQQLMAGHKDKAAAFLRAVVKTGITNFIEYGGAKAELKRLGD